MRCCWSWQPISFADVGIRACSLEFFDASREAAFALGTSERSARLAQAVLSVIVVMSAIWIGFVFAFAEDSLEALDLGTMDALRGLTALIGGAICHLHLKRKRLSSRRLEVVLLVTFALLLVSVFAEPPGSSSDDADAGDTFAVLAVDLFLTCTSLSPIRWSSMWPLHVLVLVSYPMLRLLEGVDKELHIRTGGTILMLWVLGIGAMLGKRTMEIQERRHFITVANERTLRAESEFKLSQQSEHRRRGPGSNAPTLVTADIFGSSEGTASILECIRVVAQREDWLIHPEDINVRLSQVLGQGGFGIVVEGSTRGLPVAVKVSVARVEREGAERLLSLVTELRVLRKVRHPNIVLFYGAIVDSSLDELALVMELVVGTNLHSFILKSKTSPADSDLYRISCGVSRALQHLHEHQPAIVHGDLKPSNVLVELVDGSMTQAKLADFGLSRILKGSVRELGGTLRWMAPELLNNSHACPDCAVDVYGLGRILLFMVTGRLPFSGMSAKDIRRLVSLGVIPDMEASPRNPTRTIQVLRTIGQLCCSVDVEERPCMRGVVNQLQNTGTVAELPSLALLFWGHAHTVSGTSAAGPAGLDVGADEEPLPTEVTWDFAIPWLRRRVGLGDRGQELASVEAVVGDTVGATSSVPTGTPPVTESPAYPLTMTDRPSGACPQPSSRPELEREAAESSTGHSEGRTTSSQEELLRPQRPTARQLAEPLGRSQPRRDEGPGLLRLAEPLGRPQLHSDDGRSATDDRQPRKGSVAL